MTPVILRIFLASLDLIDFFRFYEWKKDGSKKQPYYIHFKDGKALVFAALYDSWESSEGEPQLLICSFTRCHTFHDYLLLVWHFVPRFFYIYYCLFSN